MGIRSEGADHGYRQPGRGTGRGVHVERDLCADGSRGVVSGVKLAQPACSSRLDFITAIAPGQHDVFKP